MNEHRRSRLKRLAVGTALVGASLAGAQSSPVPKNVNSPPRPPPAKVDAGAPVVATPIEPGPPVRMNSPGPQKPAPAPDAGVLEAAPPDIHVNSPPRPPKATPLAVPRK